ncbi:hypothetical protein [Natrialba aegyptia]|nr:hypothetical protein [Natrialba aegyptia]
MSDDDRPLSREERIEEFDEQQVDHTEWWAGELDRVDEVQGEILESIRERPDCRVAKRGTSTSRDGVHELTFTVSVVGEPWVPKGEYDDE